MNVRSTGDGISGAKGYLEAFAHRNPPLSNLMLGWILYSFSPVRAIPRTKARWKNKKMSAAGIIPMTAIAIISW